MGARMSARSAIHSGTLHSKHTLHLVSQEKSIQDASDESDWVEMPHHNGGEMPRSHVDNPSSMPKWVDAPAVGHF